MPAGVLAAPMIPGLNDMELDGILQAGRRHGAQHAGYVLLRLPHELRDVFTAWLPPAPPRPRPPRAGADPADTGRGPERQRVRAAVQRHWRLRRAAGAAVRAGSAAVGVPGAGRLGHDAVPLAAPGRGAVLAVVAGGCYRAGMRPDFSREAEHGGLVAGVDEAGRGPLAGPVVAAAVVFPQGVPDALAAMLDDSKRMSAPARERCLLRPARQRGLDRRRRGVRAGDMALEHPASVPPGDAPGGCCVCRSARTWRWWMATRRPPFPVPCGAAWAADGLSLSIAAASIVAKVVRDRAMARLARRYPAYGWDGNAGYGTVAHRAALDRVGACRHHRAGFGAVRRL